MVVTGAANGIGKALARAFHGAGARVVIADIDLDGCQQLADELNAVLADSATAVRSDISTERGNIELIATARSRFGPIDLFFANAGIGGGTDVYTDEASWEQAFNINVHAHRWAFKHLLSEWLDRGEGYFCSTASAAGLLTQIGSAPYSMTKHAAVAFAEWVSVTYGGQGVRVSCLCPQGVNTNMISGDSQMSAVASDVVRAAGRVLEPGDVATACLAVIDAETFLIAPHREVLDYWARKVEDYDRWIGGMRKLQARVTGQS